jgi:hypothetical protein
MIFELACNELDVGLCCSLGGLETSVRLGLS